MKSVLTPLTPSVLFVLTMQIGASPGMAATYTREQQQAWCQNDAFQFCNDAIPDTDRIAACLKAHRAQLSPECKKIFVSAGSRHRHRID